MKNNLIYQYYLSYTGPNKELIKENISGFPKWAEIGIKSAKEYAKIIDVSYELNTTDLIGAPNQNLEACRLFMDPYFDKFDKILMLDVDTIVNTSDSIFEEQISDVGMIQEHSTGFTNEIISKLEKYGKVEFKKSSTNGQKRYLNGGVVLWSKEGRLKARERFGGLPVMRDYRETLKLNEQPYLNLMLTLHDIKVTELSNMWNRMNYMWQMGIPDGKINHFLAKHKERMKDYG